MKYYAALFFKRVNTEYQIFKFMFVILFKQLKYLILMNVLEDFILEDQNSMSAS